MKALIKDNCRLFALFCVASVIRFGYEGFLYYPYLDDYVQYMYYPSLPIWSKVLWGGAKTAYTRPLAAIFDVFVWGSFGENLFLAMIVLALLYGISGVLFYCALNRSGIRTSPFFLVFYGLCPLNTEGTYWVSASSRVVFSLFLVSLGAVFLAEYIKNKRMRNIVCFAGFHFLSYWFYEQTAALSFVLCSWLALRKKKVAPLLIALFSAFAFVLWYVLLGGRGNNGARLETVELWGIFQNISLAVSEVYYIFTSVFGNMLKNGIFRGFENILASPIWLFIILAFAVLWYRETKKPPFMEKEGLLLGGILFFTAFAPFYVTKNMWFNLRNTVPALLGLALVLDFLVSRLPQRAVKIITGALAAVFLLVQISEIADYTKIAKMDYETGLFLKEEYKKTGNPHLMLKGDLPEYHTQNAIYHDHIVSAAALDWGMTGVLRGLTQNPEITVQRQTKAQ